MKGKSDNNKPTPLVAAFEQDSIDRNMVAWANTFPNIPPEVFLVNYENIPSDTVCMALSTIQSANIVAKYIFGGYLAEYQFKMIYRIRPGASNDKRLKADELLNSFGDWAATQKPFIGDNLCVLKIEATSRSSLFAVYENGDEDYQILMKMTYERMCI